MVPVHEHDHIVSRHREEKRCSSHHRLQQKQSPVAATRDDSYSLTTRSQKNRCIRRSPMLEPRSSKLQPYVAVLEPAGEKATTASHRCWSRGEEKLQPHVTGAGTRQ